MGAAHDTDARCGLHGRPGAGTCVRCGAFVCDWCLKLAPSWGPGLCAGCVRRAPPPRATSLRWPKRKRDQLAAVFVLGVAMLGLMAAVRALEAVLGGDAGAVVTLLAALGVFGLGASGLWRLTRHR